PWRVRAYFGQSSGRGRSRQERGPLLASAEIVLGGFPFPLDLRARAPRLRWFHQLPAGASNLLRGDLWGSDVIVTTSRGYGNTRAMAEYVLASLLHFARGSRMHLAIGTGIVSTIAPTVRCCCRGRRYASWAPAASA